jgi:hypothetical protein
MSDIQRLEQKIDDHIDNQATSNTRVENALTQIAESMNTFVGFQARAEERQLADSKWRETVEKHQDKQDDRIEKQADAFDRFYKNDFTPVRDGQRINSLLVNGAVGFVSLVIGGLLTYMLGA